MSKTQKLIFVLFVTLVAINFGVEKPLTEVPLAYAEQPQNKYMNVGYCSCGNGCYAIGFSCHMDGDECYTSSHCFCGGTCN